MARISSRYGEAKLIIICALCLMRVYRTILITHDTGGS